MSRVVVEGSVWPSAMQQIMAAQQPAILPKPEVLDTVEQVGRVPYLDLFFIFFVIILNYFSFSINP